MNSRSFNSTRRSTRARPRFDRLEDRLASRRGAARAEVRIAAGAAWARWPAAVERYERSIVPLRQKIVGLTQAEYNAMIVGVPDLLAAKSAEIRVGSEQARAVQDYWTARPSWSRVIGVSFRPAGGRADPIAHAGCKECNSGCHARHAGHVEACTRRARSQVTAAAPVPTMPDMPGMNPK